MTTMRTAICYARLVQPPAHGTVTLDTNGAFQYTPAANYFGQDGFSYTAFDGILLSPETQVSITVRPINDAPAAVDDTFSAEEDTPLSVAAPGVLANDIDVDPDTLKVTVIAPPPHAAYQKEDGAFVYQPPRDYTGPEVSPTRPVTASSCLRWRQSRVPLRRLMIPRRQQ